MSLNKKFYKLGSDKTMDLMQIPRMVDISAVRTDVTVGEINQGKIQQMQKSSQLMKI